MIAVEFDHPQALMHLYQAVMKAKFQQPEADLFYSDHLAGAANSVVEQLLQQLSHAANEEMIDAMRQSRKLSESYPQFDAIATFLARDDFWQNCAEEQQRRLLPNICAPLLLDAQIEQRLLMRVTEKQQEREV